MKHQMQIAFQRIDNLHSGIRNAEQLVAGARQQLNHKDIDIKEVQKELEEIQDFLLWLAGQ